MTVRAVSQVGGNLDVAAYIANTRSAGRLSQGAKLYLVEQPTRGYIVPLPQLRDLREASAEMGVSIHMDGARIFNAAVSLGIPAREIAACADSVMFCISKGLGAPAGSLLVGSSLFIDRARLFRQMLGGGMRQSGILAAAGLFALENNVDRLAIDHANARRLAAGLSTVPGITIDRDHVETNIFFTDVGDIIGASEFVARLRERDVRVNAPTVGRRAVRFVTHLGVDTAQIDAAIEAVGDVVAETRPRRISTTTA
jgi:threonine aldolase